MTKEMIIHVVFVLLMIGSHCDSSWHRQRLYFTARSKRLNLVMILLILSTSRQTNWLARC